jgi:hypothetical protein
MNFNQIKRASRALSLGQLNKLDEWVHELIHKAEDDGRVKIAPTRKRPAGVSTLDNKTYRLQSIRCGKEKCKCARGKLHGPYWYSYIRVKDKVMSQYIGKKLPKEVEKKTHRNSDKTK